VNVQLSLPAVTSTSLATEAFDELASGVVSVSLDARIIAANPIAQDFFAPVAAVGRRVADLFRSCGCSGWEDLVASVAAGQPSAPARLLLADGRTLDARSRPLGDGGAVVTLLDITRYVRDAELALRDPLTGLANRAGLQDKLAQSLAHALTGETPVAMLYLDLDRFKLVNDTLGHATGDALLVKVAERLRSATREGDTVARLGGDEFAVVQIGAPQPQAAEALAARLVDLIGRTYVLGGQTLNIGVSLGIAIAPVDGTDPDTVMRRADLSLYRAKADGRGCFRFFQPGMDAEAQARRELEIDLRKALALRQFELHYQPLFQLDGRRLIGFEALMRWKHPERGQVSPSQFIPLAEEIGLIGPLGEWVLQTACREAASWAEPVSVAVNISPVQFRETDLLAAVRSALARSGLPAQRLELEITEGALLENTERVMEVLRGLRSLGVRISMDDFGTGYSSLSYLQRFPFDKVKIDQSFVRGAEHDADCGAIVRAVAALGASLGLQTTAEGVETNAQLNAIHAAGCSEVQGYFTGRPMPSSSVPELLRISFHRESETGMTGPVSTETGEA
jgi:diguanylate cyclase (GGDEF)-like protein